MCYDNKMLMCLERADLKAYDIAHKIEFYSKKQSCVSKRQMLLHWIYINKAINFYAQNHLNF